MFLRAHNKNLIKRKCIEEFEKIAKDIAPSYFIEGLIHNVPANLFTGTYENMVVNILNWFHNMSDRTNLVCANGQYYLLRDASLVCWPPANAEKFISEAIKLWNNWI